MSKSYYTMDGNEATASVAYRCTELSAIYPITPSSTMGELADEWSSKGKKNIWGHIPQVVEMQSEGGAAGTLHGALQTGVLTTTYTCSQGLLLMIPNMFKIAGELTPCVMHVSARALATHALSIFGDHADVMAVRSTGWAMLSSASVQEAHDMALIAHTATLEARIPFVHFFDGFRTSHEVNKIEFLADEQIRQMIDDEKVIEHRQRALNPDNPFIRGTAQNPDVYFQGRERANPFYVNVPSIVETTMEKFAKVTGRKYHLMDYVGHPEAERIIIIMGSGATTARETVDYLVKKGEKVGVVQVHLFRPFSAAHLMKMIPRSVKSIAVLDRTKEPTGMGEPLYLDVISAFAEGSRKLPTTIISGRYGLSSKEFTPAMVKAILDELSKKSPKNHFTVGINDDVSHTSLEYDAHFHVESERNVRAIFFGLGADGTVGANKNSIKIIGEETDFYAQGYFVYDSKKSGSRTVSHLRFGPDPIHSSYLIQSANFIGVHQFNFVEKIDILGKAAPGAVFLLNSPYSPDEVFARMPKLVQEQLIKKNIAFYVIDAYKVAEETGMGNRINTIMQTCFFAISGVLPKEEAIQKIKEAIQKTYAKKGADVVQKNFEAVDKTLSHLHRVTLPASTTADAKPLASVVSSKAPAFVQDVIALMMSDRGDEIPVSKIPVDGTFPSGTTQWEKRNISSHVAHWDPAACIQCGRCSMVCPHAVLRSKKFDAKLLDNAPEWFPCADPKLKAEGKKFTMQVYVEDCTGCGLCYETCPAKSKTEAGKKAISLVPKETVIEKEKKNLEFFETLPYTDRTTVDKTSVPSVQYLQPLFEFSGACAGCGETPYVKLISQLFGDRLLVANATGCSSIYGGNLPTTPWSKNQDGRGPAWSNSLFEDNAEFGLGFAVSHELLRKEAIQYLDYFKHALDENLVNDLVAHALDTDEKEIAAQRQRLATLKSCLAKVDDARVKHLLSIADHLVKRSIWMMGGDGWAYDIGFGGLDHVLATGRHVKVIVLDTEVYSNTGGQSSKSTPLGAVAKFAAGGKATPKKDLGLIAMSYGYVYVAHIAMGANMAQTLKAITEAEAYPGPALIIAYSHCIAHGIDMQNGMQEQKNAVDSGCWPLYRYNPLRTQQGQNPFVLDSGAPTLPLKDYLYNEVRFKTLLQANPEIAKEYLEKAQKEVDHRFKIYQDMAK